MRNLCKGISARMKQKKHSIRLHVCVCVRERESVCVREVGGRQQLYVVRASPACSPQN
jgi:hypothetical protein